MNTSTCEFCGLIQDIDASVLVIAHVLKSRSKGAAAAASGPRNRKRLIKGVKSQRQLPIKTCPPTPVSAESGKPDTDFCGKFSPICPWSSQAHPRNKSKIIYRKIGIQENANRSYCPLKSRISGGTRRPGQST